MSLEDYVKDLSSQGEVQSTGVVTIGWQNALNKFQRVRLVVNEHLSGTIWTKLDRDLSVVGLLSQAEEEYMEVSHHV